MKIILKENNEDIKYSYIKDIINNANTPLYKELIKIEFIVIFLL